MTLLLQKMGVFQFHYQRNFASKPHTRLVDEPQQFTERKHRLCCIKFRICWAQARQPFPTPQRLQLNPCEIFSKPPGQPHAINSFRGATVSKLWPISNISGGGNLILVTNHQHTIAGHHHIWLDRINALLKRQQVGRTRVLRAIPRSPAVTDEQGWPDATRTHALTLSQSRKRRMNPPCSSNRLREHNFFMQNLSHHHCPNS